MLRAWLLEQPEVDTVYLSMQDSEGRQVVSGMSSEELRELLDDLDTEKRVIAHAFEAEVGYPVGVRKEEPPSELHKALKRGWHSYGGWLLDVAKRRRELKEKRRAESGDEVRPVVAL